MKKKARIWDSIAEKINVPEEALTSVARLTLIAGSSVLIENHRGILEFCAERLRIASQRGEININGSELRLTAMNKSEILVRGKIESVECN